MQGSKHFDPMLGVDFHAYIMPPGIWPTPHISMVFDVFDYLPLIGSTVSIHGLRRTTAGTEGLSVHIPVGAPAPSSVKNFISPEAEVFMGSRTVTADGDPLARMLVPVLSCNVAGFFPPFRPKKGIKTFSMTLPLTVNLALPHTVSVGGPLTINLMALAMKAGLKGLAGAGKWVKKTKKFRNAMEKFKKFRQDTFKNMDSGFLKCNVLRAEPVDIRDGSVQLSQRDFQLPGRVPLDWVRHYSSAEAAHEGLLGPGWRTLMDTRLRRAAPGAFRVLELADGPLLFPDDPAAAGKAHAVFSIPASARLWFEEAEGGRRWYAETEENQFWCFAGEGDGTLLPAALEDGNGNGWRFTYGSHLLELSEYTAGGATGRRVMMTREAGRIGRVTLEDDALAQRPHLFTLYGYDGENRLVTQTDNAGHSRKYAWQHAGYLRYHADRLGQRFHYGYDKKWRVVHARGDGGYYDYRFMWNDGSHELVMTDSLGHESIIRFSGERLPLCEIDPAGGATFFQYDEEGLTTQITSPGGRKTAWVYDELGHILQETAADGTAWTAVWQDNRLTEYRDEAGARWSFSYDRAGNLLKTVSPVNVVQEFHYDGTGQVIRAAYGGGSDTVIARDRLGFIRAITWRNGAKTRYERDNRGNLLAETNALRQKKSFVYDGCDRPVRAVLPGEKTVRIVYDAEGQVTEYHDEGGRKTSLTYGPTGEVTACIKPDGGVIGYEYDTEDRLSAVCNELKQRWLIRRDPLGRIVEEQDWRGQKTRYRWDADGRLAEKTTPDGNTLAYRHDVMGRVTAILQGDTLLARYAYSATGQLTGCDNPYRQLRLTYDRAGRLREEDQDGFSVRHFYTAQGQYAGRESSSGHKVALAWTAAGQLSDIRINDAMPVRLEYNILGMLVREQLTETLERELRYNAQGQLTARYVERQHAPLFSQEWRHDRHGNVSSQLDSPGGETLFEYDICGQLTGCVDAPGNVQRFVHDAAGNSLREKIQEGGAAGEEEWACRAWSAEGLQHRYNRNGELVRRERPGAGAEALAWDEQGQLKSWRSAALKTEYGYDGLGRRVFSKTVRRGDEHADIRWFWWDGDALLCETRERTARTEQITRACRPDRVNDGLARQRHLAALCRARPPQEYVYYPQSFEPLALIAGAVTERQKTAEGCPAGTVYFYHNNINGAPQRLTDAGGATVWSAHTGAWGDSGRDRAKVYNPLRYQGQYFDAESGLHYNRYRYYDPECGRFISRDPIGLAGGINLYAYAPNPLSYIDPLGLTSCGVNKPIGFAQGTGESAFSNPKRVQHAARHLIDEGILPNWNKATAARFKEMGVSILENPIQTFDHVLRDGNAVKGFTGIVDGRTVAFMVYRTGPNQGLIATSIVPSLQQATNWGLTL